MDNLYNRIIALCEAQGISGYRLCKETKIQPSILTDLKMGRQSGLSAKNANKIADYFGVSVGYLLGVEDNNSVKHNQIDKDEELKFALFGGDGEITDEMFEEVKRFAKYVKQREEDKNK